MRMATCHPDRKHFAKGMCVSCHHCSWRKSKGYVSPNKKAQDARYYQENKDGIITRVKAWATANRTRVRSNHKNWRTKNPIKLKVWASRQGMVRRARERNATIGDLTDLAKVYDRAKWWKQWFEVEVDHIHPLSKNGTHEASNLQIIYGFENRQKKNKIDYAPRVIFV